VTISQYYGRASRGSSTSSTYINQQQLAEIIGTLKEEWRNEMRHEIEQENKQTLEKMKQELKEAIKIELS